MAKKYRKRTSRSRRNAPKDLTGRVAITPEPAVQLQLPIAEVLLGTRNAIEDLMREAGLLVIKGLLEDEVEELTGPRYAHVQDRSASRWGSDEGYVVLGGRKLSINKPRVRGVNGEEVPLQRYSLLQNERMEEAVARGIMNGLTTRRYEDVIDNVAEGYGVRRSSVSRHWKAASTREVEALMARRVDDMDLQAILIDGIEFRDEVLIVALGVTSDGRKQVLGLRPGATENSEVCKDLLAELIERGLPTDRPLLFVLDGSKALQKAVRSTFKDRAIIQRCIVHKERNVLSYLPPEYHTSTRQQLRAAWNLTSCRKAKDCLDKVANRLEGLSPSAANSLREGLEETLTLHRMEIPESLRKSLRSTNLIESAFSTARHLCKNVKRWRPGKMVERWVGAMLVQAEKKFRRIKGFREIGILIARLGAQQSLKDAAA